MEKVEHQSKVPYTKYCPINNNNLRSRSKRYKKVIKVLLVNVKIKS